MGEPYCLAWARDGEAFWSGHEDGQVWLWDARAFLVKNRIANLGESVITLAVSPAGNLAAAGSHGGMIVAWKTAEPDKPVYTLQAAGAGIRNLVFAPDSSLLAAGCYDGVVRLYNAKSATLIASLYADKGGDWLALSPEGWFHGSDWGIYAYLRVALGEGVREIGDGEMPRLDSRSLAQSFLRARLEGSARPGR